MSTNGRTFSRFIGVKERERERFDTHKEYGVEQIDHRGRGRHIDASRRRRSSSSSRASSVRETTASAFTDSANDANANDECSVCYGSSDGLFQSSRHDWVSEYVWDDEQQCWRIPAGRDRPSDGGGVCERLLRALGAGWEKHRCERERISSSDDVDFEWERATITTATAATTTTTTRCSSSRCKFWGRRRRFTGRVLRRRRCRAGRRLVAARRRSKTRRRKRRRKRRQIL